MSIDLLFVAVHLVSGALDLIRLVCLMQRSNLPVAVSMKTTKKCGSRSARPARLGQEKFRNV